MTDDNDLGTLLRVIPHEPGWFERHAVGFLRRRAHEREALRPIPTEENPVYLLTAEERGAVNGIVRRTIARSFLTGAASAALCAATWLLAPRLGVATPVGRWTAVGVASLIATVFEMWRIYFDHLGAVSDMLIVTGARIAATREDAFEEEVAHALARASLDLPDPTRVFEEIDPRRESSRAALLAAVVLYKGKRSISNFLAKEILLHLFPTGLMRTLVPFVSVPITGGWNALVSWRVLREARLRALGPSAVQEVGRWLLPERPAAPLSEACRVSLLRAVGVAMVRKHAAHPNLLALLWYLAPHVGACRAAALDDTRRFLDGLAALAADERTIVLQVFQVASVLDGHIGARLRALIRNARGASGLAPDAHAVVALRDLLLEGSKIEPSHIGALAT